MSKKPSSPRTARRIVERDAKKLAKSRERLAALETGGGPARPIEVESASVIEVGAKGIPCARCNSPLRLEEHAACTFEGRSLRVVRLSCVRCGGKREVYFRIVSALPS